MGPRFRVLVAVALAAATTAALPARAGGFDPYDFDVQLEMGFPSFEPACSDTGCTVSMRDQQVGVPADGMVRALRLGLAGTIHTICNLFTSVDIVIEHTGRRWRATTFDADHLMDCGWSMRFDDGSTLAGTVGGAHRHRLVGEDTVRMTGDMAVTVTAGTGVFDGYVGSGTWTESEKFSLGLPEDPPPPEAEPCPADEPEEEPPADEGEGDDAEDTGDAEAQDADGSCEAPPEEGPSVDEGGEEEAQAAAARALKRRDGGQKMSLRLRRTDGFRTRVVPPVRAVARGVRLVVATAPGAACRGSARSGDVERALGTERDANRDGLVVFRNLEDRLSEGIWDVVAECSRRAHGRTWLSRDRGKLRIR